MYNKKKDNKRYGYVSFPEFGEYYDKENSHNNPKQDLSGYIDMEMTCIDMVHIGSGTYNAERNFCKEFIKQDNSPIIPGSSIKGVIRNIAYAVSNSCIKDKGVETYDNNKGKKVVKRCIVCDMLGKMGFASRVDFSDFKAEKNCRIDHIKKSPLFSPKDIDKTKGIKFYKTKFNKDETEASALKNGKDFTDKNKIEIEAVKEGSTFTGKVYFRKLSEEQLELLLFAFGIDESFTPKIGGWKNEDLGSVKFTVKELVVNGKKREIKKTEYNKCIDQVKELRNILEPKEL